MSNEYFNQTPTGECWAGKSDAKYNKHGPSPRNCVSGDFRKDGLEWDTEYCSTLKDFDRCRTTCCGKHATNFVYRLEEGGK